MKRLPVLFLVLFSAAAAAQPSAPDTLEAADGWLRDLTLQFAGSQAQYSNWQEGGIDAVAFSARSEGIFYRVSGGLRQAHEVRLALGLLKQDTLGFRKSDDIARYAYGLEVETGGPFRPSLSLAARTQFIAGYDYSPEAGEYPDLPRETEGRVKVADAFAPLVLSQSAGVVYDPGAGFTARVGLGLKETYVGIERLRAIYGNSPDEAFRVQAGLDSELRYRREIVENVTLSSRLMAFQAFNQLGNQAPDILFENRLTMNVNSFLNVTLDAAALYDRDVTEDVQLRQSLAVGLAFSLL
ncbi:DUF3078 domain-containing protein [Rubricoccus marinus]|uniref:DUF3078 domain-containing protein n=1 Tax=Rubricoccus marinus TaxID=716817 RepID=A0A259TZJ6_9BACT|nr:DUF3078 domain-containing protein [Rubricoccus marinus]OZC02984.1 hypothetical protein BSZ36_08375 [Rubricoccus marinus]